MIPLFIQDTVGGAHGRPLKNPLYFIRKSIQKFNADPYDITVINLWDASAQDQLSATLRGLSVGEADFLYDVEVVNVEYAWDQQVEPYPDRSGSLAGTPRRVHAIVSISGNIRANSEEELLEASKHLNHTFDPVNEYLSGSSTFDDTASPNWQPFYNVGFGVLAWFDPSSKSDWRAENDWVDDATNPFAVEDYARLNRMMFVRSVSTPVPMFTKFDDFSVPFMIQLIAVDPSVYEFIAPSNWWGAGNASQLFIDESSYGKTLSGHVSDEVFVVPTYPWHFAGPGYREVTNEEGI